MKKFTYQRKHEMIYFLDTRNVQNIIINVKYHHIRATPRSMQLQSNNSEKKSNFIKFFDGVLQYECIRTFYIRNAI